MQALSKPPPDRLKYGWKTSTGNLQPKEANPMAYHRVEGDAVLIIIIIIINWAFL